MGEIKQLDIIDKQIKQWADRIEEARNTFAINIQVGKAYDDLDEIVKQMREYSVF